MSAVCCSSSECLWKVNVQSFQPVLIKLQRFLKYSSIYSLCYLILLLHYSIIVLFNARLFDNIAHWLFCRCRLLIQSKVIKKWTHHMDQWEFFFFWYFKYIMMYFCTSTAVKVFLPELACCSLSMCPCVYCPAWRHDTFTHGVKTISGLSVSQLAGCPGGGAWGSSLSTPAKSG